MVHAISPHGVIHKVFREGFDHRIEVLCGAGDHRWGNYWRLTSNNITCKRCLAIMHPEKYGSVMISKEDIRRHVQLLAEIKELLEATKFSQTNYGLQLRVTRLQNALQERVV